MRYLLTPVVIVRAVSALATVADTQHAATQVSAVEAEQFLRHQEVASSPPASPHLTMCLLSRWTGWPRLWCQELFRRVSWTS